MSKYFTTIIIILSVLTLTLVPKNFVQADDIQKENLKAFLTESENIHAKFEYPNYYQQPAAPEKIKIPAHTPLIIKTTQAMSAEKITSGDNIYFKTTNNIKTKSGEILVRANSPVEATVLFNKAKRIGKPGNMTISDFHVNAVDGTYIPLSSTISVDADDCMTLSVVLSILICPLFLLMKGGEANLPAGTTKTVYTVTDTYVTPIQP